MSEVNTVRCDRDGCAVLKLVSNNWLQLALWRDKDKRIVAWAFVETHSAHDVGVFRSRMWGVLGEEARMEVLDICGLNCLAQVVNSLVASPGTFQPKGGA